MILNGLNFTKERNLAVHLEDPVQAKEVRVDAKTAINQNLRTTTERKATSGGRTDPGLIPATAGVLLTEIAVNLLVK